MLLCIIFLLCCFFFKQKTAYEMRISDWSSAVCSSDLLRQRSLMMEALLNPLKRSHQIEKRLVVLARDDAPVGKAAAVHIGLDTKIDRMILISSTQEICMQRVDKPLVSE